MGKFLLGFVFGVGVGAGLALLLTPQPGSATRAQLREQTDRYAAGADTPVGSVSRSVQAQRNRLLEAIDAGRRASAERQAELWAQLNLAPPPANPEAPSSGSAQIV